MSTALVLGNGSLLVNIDEHLNIYDYYWPYVGQENHLARDCNDIFVYIDGQFSHLNDGSWQITPGYEQATLTTKSIAEHKQLKIKLIIRDCVLPDIDIFFRLVEIENQLDKDRIIKLFFKNNFHMLENNIGDTAIWYTPAECMVHYKKDRYLGIGSTGPIYKYACAGPTDNNGKGAYPDKKGELNLNPVATGSAQSCLSYNVELKSNESKKIDIFFVSGYEFADIEEYTHLLRTSDLEDLYQKTSQYWRNWSQAPTTMVKNSIKKIFDEPELNSKLIELYTRSLLIIRTQFDNHGAIIAANDSSFIKAGGNDTLSYFWPRDGANVVSALIEAGYKDIVKTFFDYCSHIISKEGYILHKYYPNRKDGLASSWHPWIDKKGNLQLPIQEDETALVVQTAWEHFQKFQDKEYLADLWEKLIRPGADFMCNFRYTDFVQETNIARFVAGYEGSEQNPLNEKLRNSGLPKPSYDIWEIKHGVHTYTIATVYAGITAAANAAEVLGHRDLAKHYQNVAAEILTAMNEFLIAPSKEYYRTSIRCDENDAACVLDEEIDTSIHALWKYNLLKPENKLMQTSVARLQDKLWLETEIGGMARKDNDHYLREDDSLPGNPWFISTLWMAQYYLTLGEPAKAKPYLKWVLDHADATGLLAEQADPHTGFSRSVKPLTWSHAEFVKTVHLL